MPPGARQPGAQRVSLRLTLKQKGKIGDINFSPDGRFLALALSDDEKALKLFDAGTGQLKTTLAGTIGKPAWCSDGRTVAVSTSGDKINIWDAETGRLKQTLAGQKGHPFYMEFSRDCKRLLASGGGSLLMSDGKARLWDVESGQLKNVVRHKGFLFAEITVASSFNPDGSTFMTSGEGDSEPKLWDAGSGELVRAIKVRKSESVPTHVSADVHDQLFSPDGRVVATASYDNTINLWDAHTGEHVSALEDCHAYQMAFSPDGKLIAGACSSGKAMLWDTRTGSLDHALYTIRQRITTVAFSPDGRVLAACYPDADKCNLWDVRGGALIATVPADHGHQTVLSPDGRLFAARYKKTKVRVWSTENGDMISELPDATFPAAFSPDGKTLATIGRDRHTAILWDVSD